MILIWTSVAQAGLLVEPARLYLEAEPGSRLSARIQIPGVSSETLEARIDSFILDENGEPHRGASASGRSMAGWIQLSRRHEALEVEIEVPADARGTYWAAVIIQSDASSITTRVAVPIFVTTRNDQERRIVISETSAVARDGEIIVSAVLKNEGNALARASVRISLELGDESIPTEIASSETLQALILPDSRRVITTRLPAGGVSSAETTAVVSVRYGAAPNEVVESTCSVSK